MVADARCELKAFLLAGIRRPDLAKASRRQDQAGLGAADVAECKRVLRALPVQGLQEAARAVATGDVVTRGQSRHCQKHDGGCHCGSKKETVRLFLWSCRHTWAARSSTGGRPSAELLPTSELPWQWSGSSSCGS